MSAAVATTNGEPAPQGIRWVDVPTAATKLDLDEAHVRRRCREDWAPAGKAELRPLHDGSGKLAWRIREDADPLLARVQFPEQLPYDGSDLPADRRADLLARKKMLDDWLQACAAAHADGRSKQWATERFLKLLDASGAEPVSAATLFDMQARYRREGLVGLVDRRWLPERSLRSDDPFLAIVKRRYLNKRRPRLSTCHEMAIAEAEEKGIEPRSYYACRRFIRTLPGAILLKHREGEEAYNNDAQPYLERDYSTIASNQVWCGDHHQFDVIVTHDGRLCRPWLTAFEDCRSRKILGWYIGAHAPNSDSILCALHHACTTHGIPREFYVDNGKDYDSWTFQGQTKWQRRKGKITGLPDSRLQGIFAHLDAKVTHAKPYHGQSKPIERWFGTMEDSFGRQWETYCGNNPQNKPEDHQKHLDAGHAPELADFIAAFEDWLATYHARGHRGDSMDGRCPNEVYDTSWNGTAKLTTTERALDLILRRQTRPVKVQQNGVKWNKVWYGEFDPALFDHLGRNVYLRVDHRALGQVTVWTQQDLYICTAKANPRLPFDTAAQEMREASQLLDRARKGKTRRDDPPVRMAEDAIDLVIRGRALKNEREKAKVSTTPPTGPRGPGSIRLLSTPVASQAEKIHAAEQRRLSARVAVGAEQLSFVDFANRLGGDEDSERPRLSSEIRDRFWSSQGLSREEQP